MKPQAPAVHIPILQALPKGGLPFKVSLPQSSTLQVGGKTHFALQNDCKKITTGTRPERRKKTLDACARPITHSSGLESRTKSGPC
jgi:hypothetical protein